ncbi:MAG: hypothetical protein ACLRTG_23295 [Enterocloster aldenensis]|uniref:Uncharacterized protein n=1 Tax=uncultured Anaerotruncus sp. TaxID=905011 RepID=A0A6N2RW78_9FIRM
MGYIRLDEQPGEVYHYTHRKNLDSILRDGRIRRMGDRECWFCASLEDTLTLMRATVMMEGKPYYKVGGSMYSVFCRLAKEAFEEIIRAQFLETQELSGPVLTM